MPGPHGRGQGDAELPLEQRSDLPHDAQGQVRLDREHHDLSLRGGTGIVRYQGDPIRLETIQRPIPARNLYPLPLPVSNKPHRLNPPKLLSLMKRLWTL